MVTPILPDEDTFLAYCQNLNSSSGRWIQAKRWIEVVSEREEFSGVAISRGPEVSRTDKWRYWRCGLADGSRVVVDVTDMTPAKSVISVPYEKFASPTTAIGTGRITERSLTERGGNSSSPECH